MSRYRLRRNWFRTVWQRNMLRAEAWIYLTLPTISDETFIQLMLSLRKEAMKWR